MGDPKRTRLYFMGFSEENVALAVLAELRVAIRNGDVTVEDWALVHKAVGGGLAITNDRSIDPGGVRGAATGGAAGLVLAAISGPIGAGAVLGGAVIGGVVAALRDSGIRDDDIRTVASFIAEGRTGLMVAVPLAEVGRFDACTAANVVFSSPDRRFQVDIEPGRTFEQAVADYRLHGQG